MSTLHFITKKVSKPPLKNHSGRKHHPKILKKKNDEGQEKMILRV